MTAVIQISVCHWRAVQCNQEWRTGAQCHLNWADLMPLLCDTNESTDDGTLFHKTQSSGTQRSGHDLICECLNLLPVDSSLGKCSLLLDMTLHEPLKGKQLHRML